MPKITVPAKRKFPDYLSASSLFIDSVTAGVEIVARLHYADDSIEDQVIISGSKFITGQYQWINKVEFVNSSVMSADVVYHYSRVVGYDEARVIGDINALIRSDDLSSDGNQFMGGVAQSAVIGRFSVTAIWNPVLSAVNVKIKNFLCYSSGISVIMNINNAIPTSGDLSTALGLTHNKKIGGATSKARLYVQDLVEVPGSILNGEIPASSLNLTELSLAEAPLILPPGNVIYYYPTVTNVKMSTSLEWSEVAI
jgi:hypothetical protein